jgi:hypothetical protein
LARVNPSEEECAVTNLGKGGKYFPLVARSNDALAALGTELHL